MQSENCIAPGNLFIGNSLKGFKHMRRFHSYGPVDCEDHFCVPRKELIRQCTEQLAGSPEKGGHYFTIWAPRQTGKTWLMRQVKKEIETRYPGRFILGMMSVQGIFLEKNDPPETFLSRVPLLFDRFLSVRVPRPDMYEELAALFSGKTGLFEKPLLLFIDEFDKLPPAVIDRLVGMFRDIYLSREHFCLHGLALIGVRAVLGVESGSGSPFNIQRSLHVPNFTKAEVEELFSQYQEESGQTVEPRVVTELFDSVRGQPGLVGWFGELLTERYNPGTGLPIDFAVWENVFSAAIHREWNNSLLNLIKKAQGKYSGYVLELFNRPDMLFSIRAEWCSYLYLNGITDTTPVTEGTGNLNYVCRFSSPFVQLCLYEVFTLDLTGSRLPVLALEPLDGLADVFGDPAAKLNLPALLERYKAYLKRLKAKGLNPWKEQPRRADLHLTEYAGHFHLYAWLRDAVGDFCTVSPEFPTGNGRVDLHLKCGEKRGIIEVKSFKSLKKTEAAKLQAARYAEQLGLDSVTLAVFVPTDDENILNQLSGEKKIGSVKVTVSAVGWV
jgi:hypothetical protein